MSYQQATKEEVEKEGLEWIEPKETGTVFLTGPGGKIYEIPTEIATQHEFDTTKEENHSPVTSYDDLVKLVDWEEVKKQSEKTDGEGQHMVMGVNHCGHVAWVWHCNYVYGPTGDGFCCYHRHPYGSPFWVS